MAGAVSGLITFGTQNGPIATGNLDTNFTAFQTAVNSANSYSNYLVDSGSANTIAVTVASPAAATLSAGLTLTIKVAQTNTGATTLNLNGGGAVAVVDPLGAPLASNDLNAGGIFTFVYNGTYWQVLGALASGSTGVAFADTFTATAGQTVFTLSNNPGNINNLGVSLDGSVLVASIDYTWTSPETLTLTAGAKAGQTLFVRYIENYTIGTPIAAGTNNQIQYNNSGVLNGTTIGGDATLVATTGVMKVNSVQASAIVDASLSASSNIGLTNTALVTVAATFNDGTNTISGGYRVFSGNNAASTDDSAYLVGRGLSGSYTSGAHAFRDESTYTSPSGTGLFAYASYDSIPTLGGSVHWNHLHSYQSRPAFSGSNTIDEIVGFTYQANHTGSGTATVSYGVRVMDAQGTGPITTQTAFFVDPTFGRGAANYALYCGSATVQSYHAGLFQFGSFPKIAGLTTYGAFFTHDATGNFIDNPNLTIVNGVLTMANATTSKVVSSVAANLQLDAQVVVQSLKPHLFPVYTVATLPSPASAYTYCRAFVSDSNATLTAGIGAIVAAGGANKVPIYCDGTNWRIG